MRIARWGLLIVLVSPAGIAAAQQQQEQPPSPPAQQQQQQDPLAEAARRARDQKKDQPKAAKVWDDDSIPTVTGTISVVGQAAPANAANAPTTDQGNAGTPGQANGAGAPAGSNAAANPELEMAKEQLQSLQKDLDILQRKFTLDQQMFLSKPEHDADREAAASLKGEQDMIATKQQEVADAQKKVDDLQAKQNASGGAGGTGAKQ